jgi:catechol 2,3-dioxygenase-like lactoylglutathione lyase family enzyme
MKGLWLQHVSLIIPIGAQEQVRSFYGRLLGLEEKEPPHTLAHLNLVWFIAGDEIELHFLPSERVPDTSDQRHFCLAVEDLDEYRHRLTEAGYPIIEAELIPNRPRFFCRDPFGNLVEFTTILGDYQ